MLHDKSTTFFGIQKLFFIQGLPKYLIYLFSFEFLAQLLSLQLIPFLL
jgi:hypothetical protein